MLRVLLVENNLETVQVASHVLNQLHCRFDVCSDGSDSVHQIVQNDYDLIILDWLMPRFDGRQTMITADRRLARLDGAKKDSIPVLIYSPMEPQDLDIPVCDHLAVQGYLPTAQSVNAFIRSLSDSIKTIRGQNE